MAVAAGRVAAAPVHVARPWWRNRFILSGLVVVGMVIAYKAWPNGYPWPAALVWNSLPAHLDHFQSWLSDQQSAAHPSVIFTILNGISNGLGNFVSAIASLCHKLTWVGTFVAGVL